jgi:hypothetical protein
MGPISPIQGEREDLPLCTGVQELTLLTRREMFAALISSLRIFKTAGSP